MKLHYNINIKFSSEKPHYIIPQKHFSVKPKIALNESEIKLPTVGCEM